MSGFIRTRSTQLPQAGTNPFGLSFASLDEDVEAESAPPLSKDYGTSVRIDVDYNAPQIDLHEICAEAERAVLSMLVDKRRLRLAHLAKLLNIDPKTLRVKLRKYGLHAA